MKLEMNKLMTSGTGIFIIGAAWLLFWIGPAFFLFEKDPRWGHNFVIPIVFITVGLASHIRTIACDLVAVICSICGYNPHASCFMVMGDWTDPCRSIFRN